VCAQVVHGAQTTKVNIDGGRATGVTFVVKGPDGRRHTGAPVRLHTLMSYLHRRTGEQLPLASADLRPRND
jgi:hypothetical protein